MAGAQVEGKNMIRHPLRIHVGAHLGLVTDVTRGFGYQLAAHLNTMLSETERQFALVGVDTSDPPLPENQPSVLPDAHDVDLYLFDNSRNPSQSGTWTIGVEGRVLLYVPVDSLWIAGPGAIGYEAYVTTLAKFQHEWSHSHGIRGEPYLCKNADPPAAVPLPRINSWAFPHDVFWNEKRRREMHDPAYTTRPLGYAPIATEPQNLAWALKNIRPCPGNASIIRGPYRKGPPWSKAVLINIPVGSVARAWAVPGDYRDSWFELPLTTFSDTQQGFRWSDHEHGYPLMGIRVDSEQFPPCVGYISIWELEWCAIAGIDPVVTCDPTTGTISLPSPIWPVPPPPRRPWENDPRWRSSAWWQKPAIIYQWIRTHPGVTG